MAFLGSTRDGNFQWEVLGFFSKETFHMNKTFKTWFKSLQEPCANEANFGPNIV